MPMYDLTTWFLCARVRSSASASPSVRGVPMAIALLRRIARGITASMSSAREAKPREASIAACSVSSGPMWRRWKAPWSSSSASGMGADRASDVSGMEGSGVPLLRGGFLVGVCIEQLVHVGGDVGLDAEHPGGERIGVHLLRRIDERGVGGRDDARHRRVDVGGGLHRLDHADRLARLH